MLSVTGLNKFYYIKNFTDMRCKYGRVLSVIRRQLGREPEEGDVFVVISCTLFEKRFMSDYEFMRVEYDGEQTVYRMDWRDLVTLLESPVRKRLHLK